MLGKDEMVGDIRKGLSVLQAYISLGTPLNLTDANVQAEHFVCGLLNAVYGWDLLSANQSVSNHPCIDLIDENRHIGVQVTSETTSSKVSSTINCIKSHGLAERLSQLKIFMLVKKQSRYTVNEECPGVLFAWQDDVIDFEDTLRAIQAIPDMSRLQIIHQFVTDSLPFLFAAPPWRVLLRECERDRVQQRCSIGHNISLHRDDVLSQAITKAQSGSLAIVGPSGCGKSAVASMLTRQLGSNRVVIWLTPRRVREIGSRGGRIQDGSPDTLSDVVEKATTGNGTLVIDGIDQITIQDHWRDVTKILRELNELSPRWNVIVTAQDEQWYRVRGILSDGGVDLSHWMTQSVGLLGPKDTAVVLTEYPQLSHLVSSIRLQGIIQRPRILDLLVRCIDDGTALPTDWVGESKLIEWYWETRVLRSYGYAVSSGLKELACRQADECEFDTTFENLAASTQLSEQMIAGDILCEHDERFSFEHDSLGDWARLRWLTSQGNNLNSAIRLRYNNPRWHRALRLLACQKLESGSSIDDWASLYDSCEEFRDFALDGLLFAAGSRTLLEKVAQRLFANNGELIQKTLRRSLVLCTVPNERLIEQVRQRERSPTPFLRVFSRDPTPFVNFWDGLFQFLLDYDQLAYETAANEVARATKMWLEMTLPGWPARSTASRIALKHAELVHEERLAHRWCHDRDDPAVRIYLSALTAFPEDPERARCLFKQACSRTLPPRIASREVNVELPGDRRDDLIYPEPWQDGPIFDVDTAFREACLENDSIVFVFEHNPALAAEILLALLIDIRRPYPADQSQNSINFGNEPHFGLIDPPPSLSMPHAQTGPYWAFLVYSPEHAIEFILKLVGFASDRYGAKATARASVEAGSMENPFGGAHQLNGSEGVLYWNRGYTGAPERAVAPLIALEAWLVAHLDHGNSVDAHIRQITVGARSTAFLGLLADVGRKHPVLFDGVLYPLLASPLLLIWDETLQNGTEPFRLGGPDCSIGEELFERQKEWMYAEYRNHRLIAHSESRLEPSKLRWEELRPQFDEGVQSIDVNERFVAIRNLASQRHARLPSNVELNAIQTGAANQPEPLRGEFDEAVQFNQAMQRALNSDARVKPEFVREFIESDPCNIRRNDDLATRTAKRLAELGRTTFLLVQHSDELRKSKTFDRFIQYAIDLTTDTRFLADLRKTGAYSEYTYPYWLVPIAFEAWTKELADRRLLRWIAHLACFSAGNAKSLITSLSFIHRKSLGVWHCRLINLILKWSAAWWETTSLEAQLQPNPPFDLEDWWTKTCDNFVTGSMPAAIPKLDDLYLRERPLFRANWRHNRHWQDKSYYKAPPVDSHAVLAAVLGGTPSCGTAKSLEEKAEIVQILDLVIGCHLLYLEEYDRDGNQLSTVTDEYPQLSFNSIIIDRVVDELNAAPDLSEIVAVWSPIMGLGVTAPRYVEFLICKWLWNRLSSEKIPHDLESGWRSLIEFCSSHPNWNGHADADLASLWAHLIGVDSSAYRFWRVEHKGIADRADALIGARLQLIVKDSAAAGPAFRWMSRGAGEAYQLRALEWASEAIHRLVDRTTGDGELALSIAEFLCQVWQDNQNRITSSPTWTLAFRRVLRATAELGCDLAIDLEQRISDATR